MLTPQTQIKVNLPVALWEFLASKAAKYDLPIAGYVRHLIIKDVSSMDVPVYEMSARTKKKLKEALRDRRHAVTVTNVSEYFKNLRSG